MEGHIVARKTKARKSDKHKFLIVRIDKSTVLIAPAALPIKNAKLAAAVGNYKPGRFTGIRVYPSVLVADGQAALYAIANGRLGPPKFDLD
jgi:hypothetical protein